MIGRHSPIVCGWRLWIRRRPFAFRLFRVPRPVPPPEQT